MKKLKIGGVPEHFNWPWHRLMKAGTLAAAGIAIEWQDFPGGTGAMGAALTEGRLDVAMLLTEGAVAGIANAADYRIVSLYTETPLVWGIHVPANSGFGEIDDLRGARYAISRFGSGSHLMAFAHARQRGWPVGELSFVPVQTLDGAVEAFASGAADVFLWEKFMTKPLVESGHFRRLGEFVAPWPAFVVCASAAALRSSSSEISLLLRRVLETADAVAKDPASVGEIARRYVLAEQDVADWLQITRWAHDVGISEDVTAEVRDVLADLGLIPPDAAKEFCVALPSGDAR